MIIKNVNGEMSVNIDPSKIKVVSTKKKTNGSSFSPRRDGIDIMLRIEDIKSIQASVIQGTIIHFKDNKEENLKTHVRQPYSTVCELINKATEDERRFQLTKAIVESTHLQVTQLLGNNKQTSPITQLTDKLLEEIRERQK